MEEAEHRQGWQEGGHGGHQDHGAQSVEQGLQEARLLFSGYRISTQEDEKVPWQWSYNNVNVLHVPELYTYGS